MANVSMNDIMKASFGEASSNVRATFKKTINVKQYETETVEVSSTLEMDKPLNGIERMVVTAILQAQLEYEAYIQLACKGTITNSQLETRKSELEQDVNLLVAKAEQLLGKPINYLFDLIPSEV